MCGIAGVISQDMRPPAELERLVTPMAGAQAHRGPDACGSWADAHCALAHRRLAIIDLSDAGRQPMSNAAGTLWISFNGEIYNFQALRAELESHGHRFRTRTDTEVILHAYEQWGEGCLSRLRGMFAFAIWDQPKRRLLLARDRVGKKPLVYARLGNEFLFASELQGLLAHAPLPRDVNLPAMDAYLSYGYIPAPQTGFRAVQKLPPAHYLTLDVTPAGFETHIERYWSLDYRPKLRMSEADACEALREKLAEAVRLRMISDVPLGAFLSGGIDSSIVVGLMAKQSGARVKTFSIGFQEAAYNELDHARRIADKWGTDHQEFVVEPDAIGILPTLVRHYGEPYADSSAIPTFYVSQLTRRHVTVALNGDGGDESFAGYERYLANRYAERLQTVPGVAAAARALARAVPDSINPKSRVRHLHRFLNVAAEPMRTRYPGWLTFFSREAKQRLCSREFLAQQGRDGWLGSLFDSSLDPPLDPVDAAMAVDVRSYLPYDLLVKVDITSMANSLEARSPFLDHEVMELAARLPVAYKVRGRELKRTLKRAFADLLPPENVHRRKMGFGVPVGQWFRGPLRDFLRDALLSKPALDRGYFHAAEVRRLVDSHLAGRADFSFQLWNLLMLELWHQEYIA
jgi:asparagine synthase (glutamine-hydrolysing)